MKKTLAVLLTLAAISFSALTLTGCPPVPVPQDDTDVSQSQAVSAKAEFSADDIAVAYDGVTVRPNDDASAILAKLGDGYEYQEAISCTYSENGMDKGFTYNDGGVIIATVPLNAGADYINGLDTSEDGWMTGKGIAVGSTRNDVVSAYGEPHYDEGGFIAYYADKNDPVSASLCFTLENDAVTCIGIGAGH